MVSLFLDYKTNFWILVVTKMIMNWNMLSNDMNAKGNVVFLCSDAVHGPKAMWEDIFVFFFQTVSTDIFCCFRLTGKNISSLKQA